MNVAFLGDSYYRCFFPNVAEVAKVVVVLLVLMIVFVIIIVVAVEVCASNACGGFGRNDRSDCDG